MVLYKWILMRFANYEKMMGEMLGNLRLCLTSWGFQRDFMLHPS